MEQNGGAASQVMPPARHQGVGPVGVADGAPPIGRAFVAFTGAILTVFSVAVIEPELGATFGGSALPDRLGVVGTTVFAVAGLLSGYRAWVTRSRYLVPISVVLLGAGALWSWLTFTADFGAGSGAATLVVAASAVLAVLLLAEGFWRTHFLGLFCGLGALGLSLAATLIRLDTTSRESVSLALLVSVAGMTCLYGILVEIDVAEHRTRHQLLASKGQIDSEMARTEELLHDLRSGLLAIESAIGAIGSDLAVPLRTEAARLRRLAAPAEAPRIDRFDLVPDVRDLVLTRRLAGTAIELQAPATALVMADRSDVLSIIENLLSNAERHGAPPIVVEIVVDHRQGVDELEVSVSDAGRGIDRLGVARMFERGVSTNPDGHGLGLDRARRLAGSNRGSLAVKPSAEGGARFILRLPIDERRPAGDFSPEWQLAS